MSKISKVLTVRNKFNFVWLYNCLGGDVDTQQRTWTPCDVGRKTNAVLGPQMQTRKNKIAGHGRK